MIIGKTIGAILDLATAFIWVFIKSFGDQVQAGHPAIDPVSLLGKNARKHPLLICNEWIRSFYILSNDELRRAKKKV